MGKVKAWAMSRPCVVCGDEAESVEPTPICGRPDCNYEYHEVMNAIADEQDAQLRFEFAMDR